MIFHRPASAGSQTKARALPGCDARHDEGADARASQLAAWLVAEEQDDEARAERALFDLLASLPHEAEPKPMGGTKVGHWFDRRAPHGFTAQVMQCIEKESQKDRGWTLRKLVLTAASSLLLCWAGVLVYAVILGVDPTATTTLAGVVSFIGHTLARTPSALLAGVSASSELWFDVRTATEWAYSPWLLGFGGASLFVASAALLGLGRLLSSQKSRGYEAASMRSSSAGAAL